MLRVRKSNRFRVYTVYCPWLGFPVVSQDNASLTWTDQFTIYQYVDEPNFNMFSGESETANRLKSFMQKRIALQLLSQITFTPLTALLQRWR